MKNDLQKALKTVFGYCKSKGKTDIGFEDPPYDPLLRAAQAYYGDTFSYDHFEHYLHYHLNELGKDTDLDTFTENAIEKMEEALLSTMTDVFLFIPLKGAIIDKTFSIDKISIVRTTTGSHRFPTPGNIEDIAEEVSSITKLDQGRLISSFKKFSSVRAPDFNAFPLLVIQGYGQYSVLSSIEIVHHKLHYFDIFFKLLARTNGVKKSPLHVAWYKADHYFSLGENDYYNHSPIRDSIFVNFDLSFLNTESGQSSFTTLVDLYNKKHWDSLLVTYFRSLRFYNYGFAGSEFSTFDVSQSILNTLIAAEILMVHTTRGEKKSKLASVMLGLADIPEEQRADYLHAVIEAYNDRSNLVHSGNEELSKYILDMNSEKLASQSLVLLNKMMHKILNDFPSWYREIAQDGQTEKFLARWQEKVKSYIPQRQHNLLQKLILKLIEFLRYLGNIRD